ncbi:hypothetical protein A2J03_14755 [Rhodococcus sp. EPR-157]|nr:hypothetical protein A2J03_14755 [Rhodococcus sp. EPR-157]
MSMSGWWSAASAAAATRETNSMATGNVGNSTVRVIDLRSRVHSGSPVRASSISALDSRFVMQPIVSPHGQRRA